MTCNTSAVAVCCSSASRVSVRSHRDDRLRREVLQQRDLLIGKRPHLLTIDADRTEERVILAQRHDQKGTDTPENGRRAHHWGTRTIALAFGDIGGVEDLAGRGGATTARCSDGAGLVVKIRRMPA